MLIILLILALIVAVLALVARKAKAPLETKVPGEQPSSGPCFYLKDGVLLCGRADCLRTHASQSSTEVGKPESEDHLRSSIENLPKKPQTRRPVPSRFTWAPGQASEPGTRSRSLDPERGNARRVVTIVGRGAITDPVPTGNRRHHNLHPEQPVTQNRRGN